MTGPWEHPPTAPEEEPPVCPACATPAARARARFCRACGAALEPAAPPPTAPAAADAEDSGPATRRSRRRRPGILLAIGVAVALSVLAATGQRAVQQTTTDPTDPVEEVLELIADRRGGTLAERLRVESPLITDAALASGYDPPTDMRTADVSYGRADADTRRPDRNTATVAVTYRIDGEEHRTSVRVRREATGWVRAWEVADASGLVGALTVTSTHLDQARVAGADVPTSAPDSGMLDTEQPALPGTYTVATPQDHPLFEAADVGTTTVVADAADRRPTTYDITDLDVRPGLAADVEDQVTTHLAECAEQTTLAPLGCPLRLERDSYASVEDVSWTITAQPRIRLVPADDSALHGAPLTVETTTPGTAEVTYRRTYGGDDEPEQESVDITIGGSVDIDEDGHAVWEGSG